MAPGVNKMKALRAASGMKPDESHPLLGEKDTRPKSTKVSKIIRVLTDIQHDVGEFIEDIITLAHNIDVLSEEVKNSLTDAEEHKLVQEMQGNMDQAKTYIVKVKQAMEDLDNMKQGRSDSLDASEMRMCATIIDDSGNKFKDALKTLLAAQNSFESAAKAKMGAMAEALYPEASKQEIEELCNQDPHAVHEVLAERTVNTHDGPEMALQDRLDALKSKSDALKDLARSVDDLRDIFFFMDALVDKQGESLHKIEDDVNAADEFIGETVVQLEEAFQHEKSYESKRKMVEGWWWTIFGGTITCLIVVVIIFAIYLWFTRKK